VGSLQIADTTGFSVADEESKILIEA